MLILEIDGSRLRKCVGRGSFEIIYWQKEAELIPQRKYAFNKSGQSKLEDIPYTEIVRCPFGQMFKKITILENK
ncbi:MAG: hypothetical protein AABX84_02995 [Nanoarchaeota archaeon]